MSTNKTTENETAANEDEDEDAASSVALQELSASVRVERAGGASIGGLITETYFKAVRAGFSGSQTKWAAVIDGAASDEATGTVECKTKKKGRE